jgi:hypothetical protein
MRYSLLLILVCLLVVGSAGAAVAGATTFSSTRLTGTPVLAESSVVTCTQDTFSPYPGYPIIWVIFLSGVGSVRIDGKNQPPNWAETYGGNPGFQFGTNTGAHTVVIADDGYSPFTANVQVCNGTVSYVVYDRAAHLITTAPTTTITTAVPATTVTTGPGVTTQEIQQATQQATWQATVPVTAGATAPAESLGTLSVTTTPAGVTIYIDGIKRGASPATIPGLSAGSHTLLLKLDGYEDLSTPVTISAGKTQDYSTAMITNGAVAPAATGTVNASATLMKAPGFESALAFIALGALLVMRKQR